jgi:hypothetical protein
VFFVLNHCYLSWFIIIIDGSCHFKTAPSHLSLGSVSWRLASLYSHWSFISMNWPITFKLGLASLTLKNAWPTTKTLNFFIFQIPTEKSSIPFLNFSFNFNSYKTRTKKFNFTDNSSSRAWHRHQVQVLKLSLRLPSFISRPFASRTYLCTYKHFLQRE